MSSLTTLARPYAKAAFELARAEGELSRWDELLTLAGRIVDTDEVARLLGNPMVSRTRVVDIITGALNEEAQGKFADFIDVLGQNDRLALLPPIAELFRELREEDEGRLSVRVVSAVPLEDEQRERMKAALAKRYNREIEMRSEVDQAVLGGAVIYAGDQVIDGSLRGRLQKLQSSLSR